MLERLHCIVGLRLRFFKKIQDWILKSENGCCVSLLNRSLRSCVKGTEESTLEVDSSVPLTHHGARDLGLICCVKKREIRFLLDFRIRSWILVKKRTLSYGHECLPG